MNQAALLPDAVRMIRQSQGVSQYELARRMKVPRTYISKFEGRRVIPRPEMVVRFALGLEIPAWLLVHFSESMSRNLSR
jgi:transcriptional regulator with XRE-family HTH domain